MRFLGVEAPLLLQFSIALFTGMVGATFIPPVRRSIPKPVEVLLWVALLTVCAIGILSVADPNARELSASAAWGADQMINSLVGATAGASIEGLSSWVSDHRFAIASWMTIIAGADIFALVLLRSRRTGQVWQPRIRLREWMEMPLTPVLPEPVPVSDPIGDLNRKIAASIAIAGTTTLTNVLNFSIWLRDVFVPREKTRIARAALASRSHSRSGLESLRDIAAHLQYAAMAWYAAAGQPAVSEIAVKANGAVQQARQAQRALRPVTSKAGQVVDIRALVNAQSIGWYGPMLAAPTAPGEDEIDGTKTERTDRLAS